MALVPAYKEICVASALVRLMRQVDGVIVCDDGSVDLAGETTEVLGATVVRR